MRRFSDEVLTVLHKGKGLSIRAGTTHRFIGIWFVVVKNRVFVRSWSVKERGWFRTFLEDPRGTVQIGGRKIAIRVVGTRSERMRNAVDRAYLDKYNTKGAIVYAKDLGSAKSRATTLELVPLSSKH